MLELVSWLVMVIAFAAIEAMTVGFVSICFSFGALAALIATALKASLEAQIIIFVVVSFLCILFLRPVVKKYFVKTETKTNVDSLIGAEGIVTEAINNLQEVGQVRVLGAIWTARSTSNEEIAIGTQVRVTQIQGVKAIVEQI